MSTINEPTAAERRMWQARRRVQDLERQLRDANRELTDALDEWVAEWAPRVRGDKQ